MRKAIRGAFDQLNTSLHTLEFTRTLHDEHEGHIERALDWIQYHQNQDGSWGLGSMIDTVLALQACGIWRPSQRSWPISTGIGGIALAFQWLDSSQEKGCWDSNLWDTAAIIQAACLLGEEHRPTVQSAVDWLVSRSRDRWGVDINLGLHYAAQTLIALVMVRAPERTIIECRSIILDQLRAGTHNRYRSAYVMGQVVESLVFSGVNPADGNLQQPIKFLENYLINVEVSISNFMDICSAFKGLGMALGSVNLEDAPAVQLTLGKMFHPTRIRQDGSWYRDITMTGWALVSLRSLKTVRKIEAYPYQIYSVVADAQRTIEANVTEQLVLRRRVLMHSVSMILSIVAVITAIGANLLLNTAPFENVEFLYFIIGILASTALYSGRELFRELT